jgi:hypothetical protein
MSAQFTELKCVASSLNGSIFELERGNEALLYDGGLYLIYWIDQTPPPLDAPLIAHVAKSIQDALADKVNPDLANGHHRFTTNDSRIEVWLFRNPRNEEDAGIRETYRVFHNPASGASREYELAVPDYRREPTTCSCRNFRLNFREHADADDDPDEGVEPFKCLHIQALEHNNLDPHESSRRVYPQQVKFPHAQEVV